MSAYLLARQDKSLAAPYFPGVQRPFPPLLSWDFMDQLMSLAWMQGREPCSIPSLQTVAIPVCRTSLKPQLQPGQTDGYTWKEHL